MMVVVVLLSGDASVAANEHCVQPPQLQMRLHVDHGQRKKMMKRQIRVQVSEVFSIPALLLALVCGERSDDDGAASAVACLLMLLLAFLLLLLLQILGRSLHQQLLVLVVKVLLMRQHPLAF